MLGLRDLARLGEIFQVGHGRHPVDGLPVEVLLDREMGHGRGGAGAVPVFFAGRKPDHIAGVDFLDRAAPALGAATAGGHDQSLAERVGVPRGAGAGLEGDAVAGRSGGRGGGKERIDPDDPCEPICGAGLRRLGDTAFDFHGGCFVENRSVRAGGCAGPSAQRDGVSASGGGRARPTGSGGGVSFEQNGVDAFFLLGREVSVAVGGIAGEQCGVEAVEDAVSQEIGQSVKRFGVDEVAAALGEEAVGELQVAE